MAQQLGDITQLLQEWSDGDCTALDRLMPVVFAQVRDLASRAFQHESPGHTLQPTALVNEVYLRLNGCRSVQWQNREQLFGFLADLMRRILIDHGRRRRAAKRGGGSVLLEIPAELAEPQESPGSPDLLVLDEALTRLRNIDARKARLVELKYLLGLTNQESAQVLEVSVKTVERDWKAARAWLRLHLGGMPP